MKYPASFCYEVRGAYIAQEKKNVADLCRRFHCSRKFVNKVTADDFVHDAVPRELALHIIRRRDLLLKKHKQVVRKNGRTWKKYSSCRALVQALRTEGVIASRWTVRRDLKAMGLKSRVRPRTPTRDPQQVEVKRRFKKRHVRNQTPARWVMHSDESWITCNEHTGRWQWCRKGEQPFPMERKARWNVPSVMVWAAVGVDYKSKLIIFPSKSVNEDGEPSIFRLTAEKYIRRCLSTVCPELTNPRKQWILLQDGARSHVAKQTKAYLKRKGIRYLEDFPPYSPDLNMIEAVWKELISRVGAKCPSTCEELQKAVLEAWDELPQHIINAHCQHWANALRKP